MKDSCCDGACSLLDVGAWIFSGSWVLDAGASQSASSAPGPTTAHTKAFPQSDLLLEVRYGCWWFTVGHRFHWTERGICSSFRFVPNATRNAGQNNPGRADTLPFEEVLKKLETIVQAMESEELPLETLLRKYAEGTQLTRICQDKLAEAELKIQQLEKNTTGEMKLKPLPIN